MEKQKPKRGPGKAAKRKAALSAQQTIPYVVMHPDGVCQLPGGLYTKTVEYEDINYSVASTEDQTAIFSGWSAFLNYFDTSLPFSALVHQPPLPFPEQVQGQYPSGPGRLQQHPGRYVSMLKGQIARSNNGIGAFQVHHLWPARRWDQREAGPVWSGWRPT